MSTLRTTLLETAHEFINSTAQIASPKPGSTGMDVDRLRAIRSPSYRHSFGHSYMVTKSPNLHDMSMDGWIEHVARMTPFIQSWRAEVKNAWVDESKKEVLLAVVHTMQPKGVQEADAIPHEVMWTLKMNETGDKVEEAAEYLDAMAMADIRELIRAAMQGEK